MGLEPTYGPITGNMRLRIEGIDFVQVQPPVPVLLLLQLLLLLRPPATAAIACLWCAVSGSYHRLATACQPILCPTPGCTHSHTHSIPPLNPSTATFQTEDVLVRFGSVKGIVDVKGKVISESEIIVDTPNFAHLGPGIVDVRVSLRGDSFTTTFQRYTACPLNVLVPFALVYARYV